MNPNKIGGAGNKRSKYDFYPTPADVTEALLRQLNAPISLAEQFIRKAFSHGKPFAFLLKCQFFHAKKRLKLFEECRPSMIFPLTWRPDFTGEGASLMDMMWVVWFGQDTKYTFYQPIERGDR